MHARVRRAEAFGEGGHDAGDAIIAIELDDVVAIRRGIADEAKRGGGARVRCRAIIGARSISQRVSPLTMRKRSESRSGSACRGRRPIRATAAPTSSGHADPDDAVAEDGGDRLRPMVQVEDDVADALPCNQASTCSTSVRSPSGTTAWRQDE